MIARIITFVKGLFCKQTLSSIIKALLVNSATTTAKIVKDEDLVHRAVDFVRELNANKEMSTKDKAAEFNKKLLEYAAKMGKKITESNINLLREQIVDAFKAGAIK